MSISPAEKQGSSLLKRYRDAKGNDNSSGSGLKVDDNAPNFFDAMADGGRLASAYTETKKRDGSSASVPSTMKKENPLLSANADGTDGNNPLEMLRLALLQLDRMKSNTIRSGDGADDDTVPNITAMLQGVEEFLENSTIAAPKRAVKGRLSYEPVVGEGESGAGADGMLNGGQSTPTAEAGGKRMTNSTHKLFMSNQLDLNESELEYYEQLVDELAEKLESMGEEKEDLQSICNGLGERLDKLSKRKEEELQVKAEEYEALQAKYSSKCSAYELLQAESKMALEAETAKIRSLTGDLDRLHAQIKESGELGARVASERDNLKSQLLLLDEQRANLAARLSDYELQTTLSRKQLEDEKGEQASAAKAQIALLQDENTKLLEQISAAAQIAEENQQLKEHVLRLSEEMAQLADSSHSQHEIDVMQSTIDKLTIQVNELQESLKNSEEEEERLTRQFEDINGELEDSRAEVRKLTEDTEKMAQLADSSHSQHEIDVMQSTIDNLTIQVNELQESLKNSEEEEERLTRQFEDMDGELEDSRAEVEKLTDETEHLRVRTRAAEQQVLLLQHATPNPDSPSEKGNVAALKAQLEELQNSIALKESQIEGLQQSLETASSQCRNLTAINEDISMELTATQDRNAKQKVQIEVLVSDLKHANNLEDAAGSETAKLKIELSDLRDRNERLEVELRGAVAAATLLSSKTPSKQSRGSAEESTDDFSLLGNGIKSRAELRVIMDNQLDLNESEMEYYEKQIEELVSRLEQSMEEKEEVERLLKESERTIENLRTVAASKDESLEYYSRKLEEMSALPIAEGAAGEANNELVEQLRNEAADREADIHHYLSAMEQLEEQLQSKNDSIESLQRDLKLLNTEMQKMHSFANSRAGNLPVMTVQTAISSADDDAAAADASLTNMLGISRGESGSDNEEEEDDDNNKSNTNEAQDYFGGSSGTNRAANATAAAAATPSSRHLSPQNSLYSSFRDGDDVDTEELKQRLARRDQQVKVQISQLQALQDSLSEQKNANDTLRQQKSGLKKALEEAKSLLEASIMNECNARSEAMEYQTLSSQHAERAEGLMQALTDSERQSHTLQDVIAELQSANSSMREEIQVLSITASNTTASPFQQQQQQQEQQQQQLNASGASSHSTPVRRPADTSIVGSAYRHPSSSSNTSHMMLTPGTMPQSPLQWQQRLGRAENQVDELNLQLHRSQDVVEELKLKLETAEARVNSINGKYDEVKAEFNRTREEVELKQEELDRIKLLEMKRDATDKMKQIDTENLIEELQAEIVQLRELVRDADEEKDHLEQEVAQEREAVSSLRALLEKLSEKDDTTEDLLEELREEREELSARLEQTQTELQQRSITGSDSQQQFELLQEQLRNSQQQCRNQEEQFAAKTRELEKEIQRALASVGTHAEDKAQSEQLLVERMDKILMEKAEIEATLRQQRSLATDMQQAVATKAAENSRLNRQLRELADTVTQGHSRLHKLETELNKQVAQKLKGADSKVERAARAVESITQSLPALLQTGMSGICREDIESRMKDAQTALQNALDRLEEESHQREQVEFELRQATNEIDRLQDVLEEASTTHREQLDRVESSAAAAVAGSMSTEDFNLVLEQLKHAEHRAAVMSAEGAKAFARSSRNIAFLEGECSHQKTLVDHLRMVNIKLMGDLKAANEYGMRCKSLEHRLHRIEQDEIDCKESLAVCEVALSRKEQELLTALQHINALEDSQQAGVEEELVHTHEILRSTQNALSTTKKEAGFLKEQLDLKEKQHQSEVDNLIAKLSTAEREANAHQRLITDGESETRQLRRQLQEKAENCTEAEDRIAHLTQELRTVRDNAQQKVNDLNDELTEKIDSIRTLENSCSALRAKLGELEASFITRDEEMAAKMLRRAAAEDENRQLRSQNESLSVQLTTLQGQSAQYKRSAEAFETEVESLRNDVHSLKHEKIRGLEQQLALVRDQLAEKTEDCTIAEENLANDRDLLQNTRDTLTNAQNQLQNLQSDLISSQSSEQVLRASNETLIEENTYLRKQCDELVGKLNSQASDTAAMRQQVLDQTGLVKDLEDQAVDLENKLKVARSKLNTFEIEEAETGLEIQSFVDSLLISPSTGIPKIMSRSEREAVEQHQRRGVSADILAESSVDGAAAAAPQTATKKPSNRDSPGFAISADLFASPPLTMPRSPLELFADGIGTDLTAETEGNGVSTCKSVRRSFTALRAKTESLVTLSASLQSHLENARRERDELRSTVDKNNERFELTMKENETLRTKLGRLEDRCRANAQQLASLEADYEHLNSESDSLTLRVHSLLKEMDTTLLESVNKANDAAAGIVPISASDMETPSSSLVISQSSISGASNGGSALNLLVISMTEVDRTLSYILKMISKLVVEHKRQRNLVERGESALSDKQSAWATERAALQERIGGLEEDLEAARSNEVKNRAEIDQMVHALAREKAQLKDVVQNSATIEKELKDTARLNNELRTGLNEAESVCSELRRKLRAANAEAEKKIEEMSAMNDQLLNLRKINSDSELQQEKDAAVLSRVRAEKDALDNVRRSLEGELERARLELKTARGNHKVIEEGSRATFEIEKLLAALSTTMDQVSAQAKTSSSSKTGASSVHGSPSSAITTALLVPSSNSSPAGKLLPSGQGQSVTERVDGAVKKLAQLRSWARDEARARRTLDAQCESALAEAAAARTEVEEVQAQLRRALLNISQKDGELKEKAQECADLKAAIQRLQEDVAQRKREIEDSTSLADAERKIRQKAAFEIRQKESEIEDLQTQLADRSAAVARLQDQVQVLRNQLRESQDESAGRAEQLRLAKQSSAKIMASVEELQRGSDKEGAERDQLERRLMEAEVAANSAARMKTRITELETALQKALDEARNGANSLLVAEEHQLQTAKELEMSRKKVAALEHRIEAFSSEKNSFQHEIEETRLRIQQAKEFAEQERQQRMRADAAVEALKRVEAVDRRHYDAYDVTAKSDELEMQQLAAEEEKRQLRQRINELRSQNEEKESLRVSEATTIRKLENDIKQLKSTLAKRNAELTTSANYASMLRSEGRSSRAAVLEAVGQIREVVNAVRIDAQQVDVHFKSPSPQKSHHHRHHREKQQQGSGAGTEDTSSASISALAKSEFNHEDTLTLGLGEALGITQLSAALSTLREVMVWIRSAPKNRIELEAAVSALEEDKQALQKDLRLSEQKRSEVVSQCKEEIKTMNLQINELRRTDSKNPHLMHQIATLESLLQREQEKNEKASDEIELLREKLEKIADSGAQVGFHAFSSSSSSSSQLQSAIHAELESMRSELSKHQADRDRIAYELKAVHHHRTVLRDTTEQLERTVKEKTDRIAELEYQLERNFREQQQQQHNRSSHSVDVSFSSVDWANSSMDGGFPVENRQYGGGGGGSGTSSSTSEEALMRQVARFKARAAAMEELSVTYRVSVLALYADGTSYGAAQFGWQPYDETSENRNNNRGNNDSNILDSSVDGPYAGLGVGWIEREMTAVKHCYEDEIRLLDSEISDLRAQLRQSRSFTTELRRRYEDSMKSMYRSGGRGASEGTETMLQQLEHLRESVEGLQSANNHLSNEVASFHTRSRQAHNQLADELTRALSGQHAAMSALKRLEQYCKAHGVDLTSSSAGLTLYEHLKHAIGSESAVVEQQALMQQKSMHSLARNMGGGGQRGGSSSSSNSNVGQQQQHSHRHHQSEMTSGTSSAGRSAERQHTSGNDTGAGGASRSTADTVRSSTPSAKSSIFHATVHHKQEQQQHWMERGLNHTAADHTGTPQRSKSNPSAGRGGVGTADGASVSSRLSLLGSKEAFISEAAAATAASVVASFESAAAAGVSGASSGGGVSAGSARPEPKSFLQPQGRGSVSSSGSLNNSFNHSAAAHVSPAKRPQRSSSAAANDPNNSSTVSSVESTTITSSSRGVSRLQHHQERLQQQQQQESLRRSYVASSGSAVLRVNKASR